jgi:hypothetical protein
MMAAFDFVKGVFALIGVATVLLGFVKLLLDVIPKLNALRADVYRATSQKLRHRALEKRAIASNIEAVVNDSVSFLQKELPIGWISRAKIEWVREESRDDMEDGDLILRMRPLENQDENLMNGIFYFFTKALFRGVKEVIPRTPRRAAVLQLSRRTVTKHHPYAMEDFERRYLEPAICVEADVAFYLGHYDTLDQRGFFTGVYLREITALAERVRYTAQRSQIGDELRHILTHVSTFLQASPKAADELWHRKSDTSSYGLLLVARPPFSRRREQTYVNRAQSHIRNGVKRLYVLGANQEKSFVRKVVSAIANETSYALVELFDLNKDYRGEAGGICAVFDEAPGRKEIKEPAPRLSEER